MKKFYRVPRVTVAVFKVEDAFESFKGYSSSHANSGDAIRILDESSPTEEVGSGTIYGSSSGSWF